MNVTKKLEKLHSSIIQRCYNKKTRDYKSYGARGITVCDEWRDNKEAFITWAKTNGYELGLTIDRKNNDLGYSSENCRFVSQETNARNTRSSKWWIIKGAKYTSAQEAATVEKVTPATIRAWCMGWSQPKMNGLSVYPPKEGCYCELKYPEQMELDL